MLHVTSSSLELLTLPNMTLIRQGPRKVFLLFVLLFHYHFVPCLAYSNRHSRSDIPKDDTITNYTTESDLLTILSQTPPPGGQGDYTCGPEKSCYNGACCGEDGWCGYGPKYCGDGCQSNCDAKAECGEFSDPEGKECPLNVCCSEFGFCGTTEDFCGDGCASNCEQPKPSGPATDTQKMVIGYWEAWNMDKPCGTMSPNEIPVNMLTHLIVSFGYISQDFRITNMDGISSEIYRDIGNIKARNPSLKIMIALGGWTFSDPGPWQNVFPDLASSQENRKIFINNLIGFMSEYGYDGVGMSLLSLVIG